MEKINQGRIHDFVEKIRQELWVLRGKKVAIWGLAFKPDTDDVRFAPSIALIKSLLDEGATVSAYDPEAMEKAKALLPPITYCADPYQAAQGADAVLLVTESGEFLNIDWDAKKGSRPPLDSGWKEHAERGRRNLSRLSLHQHRTPTGAFCPRYPTSRC